MLLFLSLAACTQGDRGHTALGESGESGIPIPISLTSAVLASGTMTAYITCGILARQPVDSIDLVNNTVTATCSGLQPGEHTFRIDFEFVSTEYGATFALASAEKTVMLVAGPNEPLNFIPTDYDPSIYDEDNDGVSNLDELNGGTNPTNPDVLAPEIASVLPPNGNVISSTRQIVIVFNESMDTQLTALTLGGSMLDRSDGGFWSSGDNPNDTLTIGPSVSWFNGVGQTLTVQARDLAGNLSSVLSQTYDVDAVAPTAIVNINNGTTIGQAQNIIISFNEAMDNTSLTLAGSMAATSTSQWTTTSNANDTLTISPNGSWNNGSGQTLTVDAQDLIGNALTTLNLTYNIDALSPSVSVDISSGSRITTTQVITVSFSKTMNITTYSLSGSMAANSDGGVWSTTINSNDTLVISPDPAWSSGGQQLIVNASDLAGNPAATLSLSYSVDAQAPTAVVDIASTSVISRSQPITLTFSESMDSNSQSITGTMAAASDNGVWSTTIVSNDTLTISPTTNWNSGSLSINARDIAGNAAATINLNYSVDATAAIANVDVVTGSTIPGAQIITISFNESMDRNSDALSGSMAAASNGGVWSTSTNTDDTLTISPNGSWITGSGQTLSLTVNDLFGNTTNVGVTYTVDAVLPTATVDISNNATISTSQAITISFSEAMDIDTKTLGGTMAAASNQGVWSMTVVNNDTLTISPLTLWNNGAQTLTVDGNDLVGNPLATLSLSFTVDALPASVSVNISDGSTISTSQAIILSFTETMDTATSLLAGTMIAVGSGTWSTSTNTNDTLTIIPDTLWPNGSQTLSLDVSDINGNAIATLNLTYNVDAVSATATADIANNSNINGSQVITITFNEAMDPLTAVLAGSMAANSDGGVWSNNSFANDTLTISPTASWLNGNRTLTVDAQDLFGNPSVSLNLSYIVDAVLPVASVDVLNGSTINDSQFIIITFTESMDALSATLAGSMKANSDGGVWSSGSAVDDTLTISPTTSWSSGPQTLTVTANDLVGNSSSLLSLDYTVDNLPPNATVDIASGSAIPLSQAITISFNEAMDPGSLQISGTMSVASNGGAWTTTVEANDTLTISPMTLWDEAPGQTLIINATDLVANPLPTLLLTYNPNTNSLVFVTSTSGNGNLSTWPAAAAVMATGLAAGDAICNARATAGGLVGNFVAWISDAGNDAYCRVHGLSGLKANNCGLAVLPAGAGPWVRTDGYPFSPTIDGLTTGEVYTAARLDEFGVAIPYAQPLMHYSGTTQLGEAIGSDCNGWTDDWTTLGFYSTFGSPYATTGGWSSGTSTGCNTIQRLLCFEEGRGIALPVRTDFPATGKTIFVTSSRGNGNLATWLGSGANTGVAAGDAICQTRAGVAGLANAANFKAWLTADPGDTTTFAINRIVSNGPWVRPDGVLVANSKADLVDGEIFTGISVDELGNYLDVPVWTGTDNNGLTGANTCSGWASSTLTGTAGDSNSTIGFNVGWSSSVVAASCSSPLYHLYCLED